MLIFDNKIYVYLDRSRLNLQHFPDRVLHQTLVLDRNIPWTWTWSNHHQTPRILSHFLPPNRSSRHQLKLTSVLLPFMFHLIKNLDRNLLCWSPLFHHCQASRIRQTLVQDRHIPWFWASSKWFLVVDIDRRQQIASLTTLHSLEIMSQKQWFLS